MAVLALYSRQPPSVIRPGTVVKAGDAGLASCTFLPAFLSNGCSPLRAAVTETGSLVVFKGGQQVGGRSLFRSFVIRPLMVVLALLRGWCGGVAALFLILRVRHQLSFG